MGGVRKHDRGRLEGPRIRLSVLPTIEGSADGYQDARGQLRPAQKTTRASTKMGRSSSPPGKCTPTAQSGATTSGRTTNLAHMAVAQPRLRAVALLLPY